MAGLPVVCALVAQGITNKLAKNKMLFALPSSAQKRRFGMHMAMAIKLENGDDGQ